MKGSGPKQHKYTIWLFFNFTPKLPFFCIQTCFHVDFIARHFFPLVCASLLKKKRMHKTHFFLAVSFGDLLLYKKQRKLLFMPPGKTGFSCICFFSKTKRKPGEKMPGDEVNTKTSLYVKNWQFVSKILKKPNHIITLFWL